MDNLPKVHKRTSFFVCLILGVSFLFMGVADRFYGSIDLYENAKIYIFWGLALLLIACLLKRRNDRERAEYKKAVEDLRTARFKIEEHLQAEREASKQRQAEWERTHGRIVTKVAGVTFDNDDGSSRQRILKAAMAEEASGSISLELYEYRGADAIAVFYDDERIGNIPKNRLAEVKAVMDRITGAYLEVSRFRPEDEDEDDERKGVGEYIYHADLTITYLTADAT